MVDMQMNDYYRVLYSLEFSQTVFRRLHYPTSGRESLRGYVLMLGPAKLYLFVNNELTV